ncbi:MAG: nuclear transport factor 2 family protein [Cyclobacteriaceae bacterium]
MKKNRIIFAITCLLVSGNLFLTCKSPDSNELTEADKQHFTDLTAKAQDDWNRGDREAFVNRFSADAIFMAPNMESVIGKEAIRTFANAFPVVQVEFNIVEIMGSGEFAYVRGTFVVTDSADAVLDKGKFANLWKKSSDNPWQITRDIYNSDLPVTVARAEVTPTK